MIGNPITDKIPDIRSIIALFLNTDVDVNSIYRQLISIGVSPDQPRRLRGMDLFGIDLFKSDHYKSWDCNDCLEYIFDIDENLLMDIRRIVQDVHGKILCYIWIDHYGEPPGISIECAAIEKLGRLGAGIDIDIIGCN